MELALSGKRVLVSGGSRGIGLACAIEFVEQGALVAVIGRDNATLASLAEKLPAVICLSGDVGNSEEASALVASAESTIGPLDVVVSAAGSAARGDPLRLQPQDWHDAFEAKFMTYINVVQPTLERMRARGRGCAINIIGTGGKCPRAAHLAGGAANAALSLATAGLARVYAPHGVRVLGVSPGSTATDLTKERARREASIAGVNEKEILLRLTADIPQGRMADASEVAALVAFLASERAQHITGVNIPIDGGATAMVV